MGHMAVTLYCDLEILPEQRLCTEPHLLWILMACL